MPTGSIGIAASVGGVSTNKTITKTADHPNTYEVTLPTGVEASTWTKTDGDTGNAALPANHGLTNGTYDAFWNGGVHYGATGVVTDNDIALDGGSGDDFPNTNTANVVICEQSVINAVIDGDTAEMIVIVAEHTSTSITNHAHVDFQDSNAASIEAIDLIPNEPWTWWNGSGITNPFTGNPVASAKMSSGDDTNAGTLKIMSLEDSTP